MSRRYLVRVAVCALILILTAAAGGCFSRHQEDITLNLSGAKPAWYPAITGVNTNFFSAPEKVGNEKVWEDVERANIPVMRFPGGRGNFYDWRTGVVRELDEGDAVPVEEFMSRASESSVSVSYVLDITESPKNIRALARTWRRVDAPIRWVELGNEYYLPKLVNGIGGPTGYLKRARTALDALRAGGYRGAVGLVVAPDKKSSRDAFRRWNEKIARADTSDFDAVILHDYTSLENKDIKAVYREGPSELADSVESLRRLFPDKQIWVTEWNLGRPADSPEINTLGHALFDLRMLKALADERVALACYHTLMGRGWELLGPDRFALGYENGKAQLIRRVPYFALEMVGQAASDGAKYMRDAAPGENIEYMAFRTRDELRVVAWTLSEERSGIKVEVDGASPEFVEGEMLRGDLDDTNGSLLRMKDADRTWKEEVGPVPIKSPRIEGPGVVLLVFSLAG